MNPPPRTCNGGHVYSVSRETPTSQTQQPGYHTQSPQGDNTSYTLHMESRVHGFLGDLLLTLDLGSHFHSA